MGGASERIARLRERAEILRALARSFDLPAIRERLLALARGCEARAQSIAEREGVAAAAIRTPPPQSRRG